MFNIEGKEKKKVFWEESKKDVVKGTPVVYDGTPFTINSTTILSCRYGKDKNAARKRRATAQKPQVRKPSEILALYVAYSFGLLLLTHNHA